MPEKSVSFSEDSLAVNLPGFRTWPKRAIKYSPKEERSASQPPSTSIVEQDLSDVYYRFKTLGDVDVARCLKHIIDGGCEDDLLSYSVLNIILKSEQFADIDEDTCKTPLGITIETKDAIHLMEQASKALDRYRTSPNVLDSRILQQVLRSVENIWNGPFSPRTAANDLIRGIAVQCVALIKLRPSSKLLLGPAVRIINLALTEALPTAEQIKEMVEAFSCARFVFAAGFSAEVMIALNTVSRVSPSILAETAHVWVRMAVRSLIATSAMTRSLALNILIGYGTKDRQLVALALSERCDPERADSEALVKHVLRKFTSIISNAGGANPPQQDDGKFVLESWSLFVRSATSLSEPWPLLDYMMDIERTALRAFPKLYDIIWGTLLATQKSNPSFSRLLTPPLLIHSTMGLPINRMAQEAMSVVDATIENSWDYFVHPVLKHLALRKDPLAVQLWSQVASALPIAERQMTSYTELLSLVTRTLSAQHISACQATWEGFAEACSTSRQRAMNLIRLHYNLYTQASFATSPFSLPLLSTIVKAWTLPFMIEQSKNSSFSLLTLLFLPVVLFVSAETKSEYINAILGTCKSETALRQMLDALLDTVHAGTDDQLNKWMTAGSAIREQLGWSRDTFSVNLCTKALVAFLPISESASAAQWSEWRKLFDVSPLGREKILAKINNLSDVGLRHILGASNASQKEKVRITVASLCSSLMEKRPTSSTIDLLKSADLSPDFLDSVARELVTTNEVASAAVALAIITEKRIFVIAKPLFAAIDRTRSSELVDFWNKNITPTLHKCPPFISKPVADQMVKACPKLVVPSSVLIPLMKPLATPSKRLKVETPPSSAKRPRRTILTGSVPTPLSTPPVSSDSAEDLCANNEDQLCSSPPQRTGHLSSSDTLPNWRSSQQERARSLKRVMMGLDMDEAVQDMKRSEQEMIYNLMFRSCVKLRTHLAATSKPQEHSHVEGALAELKSVRHRREALQSLEDLMVENGRRRQLEGDSSDSLSDEDSELEEDDTEDFFNCKPIKIEN